MQIYGNLRLFAAICSKFEKKMSGVGGGARCGLHLVVAQVAVGHSLSWSLVLVEGPGGAGGLLAHQEDVELVVVDGGVQHDAVVVGIGAALPVLLLEPAGACASVVQVLCKCGGGVVEV